jgi:hypothetical protein
MQSAHVMASSSFLHCRTVSMMVCGGLLVSCEAVPVGRSVSQTVLLPMALR